MRSICSTSCAMWTIIRCLCHLCKSLTIRDRRERDGKTLILADMTMAYKMLSETFTTQVLMDREALKIDVKYIEGPFRHLDNQWQFEEIDPSFMPGSFQTGL